MLSINLRTSLRDSDFLLHLPSCRAAFWGLSALKSDHTFPDLEKAPRSGGHDAGGGVGEHPSVLQRMMAKMLPRGPASLPLSQMNFGGAGPKMMQSIMAVSATAMSQALHARAELRTTVMTTQHASQPHDCLPLIPLHPPVRPSAGQAPAHRAVPDAVSRGVWPRALCGVHHVHGSSWHPQRCPAALR